ncbi:unnamed protein product [Agarophyton chilense]|eukprot:gb/GEZJ01000570.1/.p2 GENE.gb/GEZJ01000570.1/~~gb/GEZJ01000570.1/.p2  ORF type:complete len:245 (+),score=53.54 gb/GEZJ01000570.1/:5030-5764(+)
MALEDFRTKFGKVMMELVATAMLVMTVQISVAVSPAMAPLAIGFVLVLLVYAAAPISGGHVNPAVTFSVFLRGKISLDEMLLYWIFQIAGGALGALLGGIISGSFFALQIGEGFHFMQAFVAEFTFTALLCFVVLATATNSKVENNQYFGAAIGLVVLVGAIAVGPISGGAFNPAVIVGLNLIKHFWKIPYMLWITLADMAGALAGAFVFYVVAPDEFEHFSDAAHQLSDQIANEAASLLPSRT